MKHNDEKEWFSLVSIMVRGEMIFEAWISDHFGTLESASRRADEVNAVNSNALDIAVVPCISGTLSGHTRSALSPKFYRFLYKKLYISPSKNGPTLSSCAILST